MQPLVLSVNDDNIWKIAKEWSNSSTIQRAIMEISDQYYQIQRLIKHIDPLDFFKEWLSKIENHGENVISSRDFEYMDRHLKKTSNVELLQKLEEFYSKSKELFHYIQEFISDLKENEDYIKQEGQDYNKMLEQMINFKDATQKLLEMKKWYATYCERVNAMFDLKNRKELQYYTNNGIHPKTNNTETLYHATVAVSKILKEGFKTRNELGEIQALGGGPGDVISFTSDIQIAESIVWALRRAVQIAKGTFTLKDLMKLTHGYGITKEEEKKMMDNHFSSHGPVGRTKDDKDWLFSLFKLWFMKQNRVFNPVFSGVSVSDFKNININDIGIIATSVDMTNSKEYLWAMEEYRVPKSAILSIWKVPYRGKEIDYFA
jgi:CRISPR/Cas system CMR-associated protein Cmr5 small subunit